MFCLLLFKIFFFIAALPTRARPVGSSMKNACRWDAWKCQQRNQSTQDGAEEDVGVINRVFPDRGCGVGRKVKDDMGKGGAPQGEVCSTVRLRGLAPRHTLFKGVIQRVPPDVKSFATR